MTSSDPTTRQFRGALRSFQNMVGLDQTGILDDVTFEQMTQPRCGNTDVSGSRERRKRFGLYLCNKEYLKRFSLCCSLGKQGERQYFTT